MLQYSKNHPLRPVDWRWEKARAIRESNGRMSPDDSAVADAVVFQKELAACKDDFDRYVLMEKEPDLYYAYIIRGDENSKQPIKAEIEARILAIEDFDKIADRCGCSVDTIKYFEKMFFNVNDKLKNTSYILHQVMGPAIHRGMSQRDYDLLWKLYGYFCGSAVVDAVTTTFTNPTRPETPEQVDAMFIDDTKTVMRRKAAIAARTIAVNEYTQAKILELYAQFLEVEKDTGGGSGGGSDVLLENIKVMMTALPWSTGTAARKNKTKLSIEYDNNSAELRSDEIMAISLNNETDEMKEISNIKFPEAKPNDGK